MKDKKLQQLQQHFVAVDEMLSQRGQLIDEARQAGATWDDIVAMTGMSRAGVIKLYNKYLEEESQ